MWTRLGGAAASRSACTGRGGCSLALRGEPDVRPARRCRRQPASRSQPTRAAAGSCGSPGAERGPQLRQEGILWRVSAQAAPIVAQARIGQSHLRGGHGGLTRDRRDGSGCRRGRTLRRLGERDRDQHHPGKQDDDQRQQAPVAQVAVEVGQELWALEFHGVAGAAVVEEAGVVEDDVGAGAALDAGAAAGAAAPRGGSLGVRGHIGRDRYGRQQKRERLCSIGPQGEAVDGRKPAVGGDRASLRINEPVDPSR